AGAIDLMPTLTALAGIPRIGSKPLDGVDLSPLLLGTAKSWPDRMIFSTWNGGTSVRTQQHRLDDRGALFDMAADPGQTRDIAADKPDVAAKLAQAVSAWRLDLLGGEAAGSSSGTAAAQGSRGALLPPDGRPFPVGYAAFPWTPLPARDGVPHGGIRRSSSAPNSS